MPDRESSKTEITQQEALKKLVSLSNEAKETKDIHERVRLLEEAYSIMGIAEISRKEKDQLIQGLVRANERLELMDRNQEILESELADSLSKKEYNSAALHCIDLSKCYYWQKDLSKASEIMKQGVRYADLAENSSAKGALLVNLGLVNATIHAYDQALEHLIEAERTIADLDNKTLLITIHLNLINTYNNLGQFEDALEIADKTIRMCENEEHEISLAGGYINRGTVNANLHRYNDSISDFLRGVEILEKNEAMPNWLHDAYVNLSNMYLITGDVERAESWLNKTLEFSQKVSDENQHAAALTIMGKLHIKKKSYNEALKYLKEAERLAKDNHLNEVRIIAYEQLVNVYGLLRRYKKKSEYLQKIIDIERHSFPKNLNEQIANMKVRWETERKEQESHLLRKKNQELEEMNDELKEMYDKLSSAQDEIINLERKNSIYAMAVTANHEINQPLMIIKGNIEMLVMKFGNESINPYLKRIDEATVRIDRILTRYKDNREYKMQAYSDEIDMVVFEEEE